MASVAGIEGPDGERFIPPTGALVALRGLQARPELNGKRARIIDYKPGAGRWAVRLLGSGECVKVRPQNLSPCTDDAGPEEDAAAAEEEAQIDRGSDNAGQLKAAFDEVVARHGLNDDARAGEVADFLTSGDEATSTPAALADRFGIPEADAAAFLAWIRVGRTFKRETDENAAAIGADGMREARAACEEGTGA